MKKYFLTVLAFFLWFILPPSIYAEGTSLTLSPSTIELTAQTPAEIYTPFTLKNNSNEPVELMIMYRPFRAADTEDGQVEYLPEPFSHDFVALKKQIHLLDNEQKEITDIHIGPKQEKKLQLKIILPDQKASKDVYFSAMFIPKHQALPEKEKEETVAFSRLTAGVAMHILLSLNKTDEKPTAQLQEFSTSFYHEGSPIPFTVRIYNTGKHLITPKGIILIKNMFGQTVGRLDIEHERVLSGSTRALTDKNTIQSTQSNTGLQLPVTIWEEKGLFGWYTASLSIALSQQGPIITKDLVFIVFPLSSTIGIGVIISLITIIIIRVRNKLS